MPFSQKHIIRCPSPGDGLPPLPQRVLSADGAKRRPNASQSDLHWRNFYTLFLDNFSSRNYKEVLEVICGTNIKIMNHDKWYSLSSSMDKAQI